MLTNLEVSTTVQETKTSFLAFCLHQNNEDYCYLDAFLLGVCICWTVQRTNRDKRFQPLQM
ncbi:uncharacterized protein LOC144655712 isoform X5 [Oculina patagonica]